MLLLVLVQQERGLLPVQLYHDGYEGVMVTGGEGAVGETEIEVLVMSTLGIIRCN